MAVAAVTAAERCDYGFVMQLIVNYIAYQLQFFFYIRHTQPQISGSATASRCRGRAVVGYRDERRLDARLEEAGWRGAARVGRHNACEAGLDGFVMLPPALGSSSWPRCRGSHLLVKP